MIEEKIVALIDTAAHGNNRLDEITQEVKKVRELQQEAVTSRSDARRVQLRIDNSLAGISSLLTHLYWVVVCGLALLIPIAGIALWQ